MELGQAELQKTEAEIADTDAQYQYYLTRLILAYTMDHRGDLKHCGASGTRAMDSMMAIENLNVTSGKYLS